MWKRDSIAWVAGIIEGEGCLRIEPRYQAGPGKSYYSINVNMTDKDVVEKLLTSPKTISYLGVTRSFMDNGMRFGEYQTTSLRLMRPSSSLRRNRNRHARPNLCLRGPLSVVNRLGAFAG